MQKINMSHLSVMLMMIKDAAYTNGMSKTILSGILINVLLLVLNVFLGTWHGVAIMYFFITVQILCVGRSICGTKPGRNTKVKVVEMMQKRSKKIQGD